MTKKNKINYVNLAVKQALSDIDAIYLGRKTIKPLSKELKRVCDNALDKPDGTKIACLMLAYYSFHDKSWDFRGVPKGIRGAAGDKLMGSGLAKLNVAWKITAAFESIGTKSNVRSINLQSLPKFEEFLIALEGASEPERIKMAEYLAWRFSEKITVSTPIPPLDASLMTYHKSQALFYDLLATKSSGYIQQFAIAALLEQHRSRFGNKIKTHKVHAADKYDKSAGDIEEYRDDNLVQAYEVTVRDDWKNRIHNFTTKMAEYGLSKYIIIASDVRKDDIWGVPAKAIIEIEQIKHNIAVVDIHEFVNVFLMELNSDEIISALKRIDEFLKSPELCGVQKHIDSYKEVLDEWVSNL